MFPAQRKLTQTMTPAEVDAFKVWTRLRVAALPPTLLAIIQPDASSLLKLAPNFLAMDEMRSASMPSGLGDILKEQQVSSDRILLFPWEGSMNSVRDLRVVFELPNSLGSYAVAVPMRHSTDVPFPRVELELALNQSGRVVPGQHGGPSGTFLQPVQPRGFRVLIGDQTISEGTF
jgi:hypothetical protein